MGRITAKDIDVSTLLVRNNFYIPSYQRGYAWKEETAGQLFDDLYNHLIKKSESDYFIGNIIVYNNRDGLRNELVVVDGQQRITTFMLLITALRVSSFSSGELETDEKIKLEEKLRELVISKVSSKEEENKIKLFSNRQEVVSEIINCDLKNTNLLKDEWAKNIDKKYKDTNYLKNLHMFIKKINKLIITFDDYLMFITLLERVMFVMIDIENNENVHEIFENINSKGMDLSLMDLVKNYLYILLETDSIEKLLGKEMSSGETRDIEQIKANLEDEISQLFEEEIESLNTNNVTFITNYLILLRGEHFTKNKEKEVYVKFKEHIFESIYNSKTNLKDILIQIRQQVNLIRYIENFDPVSSSELYNISLFMNKTNLTGVIFPFIYKMALKYNIFDGCELDLNGEFEDFIILMDKFFTRRYIVKSSDKNYNKYIPTLLTKIDELEDYDINTMEELLTDSDAQNPNGSLMKPKKEVLRYFKNRTNPYKTNNPKEIKQIMFRINFFITRNSNESVPLTDEEYKKFTVEHVMPQNPNDNSNWLRENNELFNSLSLEKRDEYEDEMEFYNEQVQNWGNLTITQDNSKLSNDDFEIKREIFESSTLKINKYIASCDKWGQSEIEKRKSALYEIIEEHF